MTDDAPAEDARLRKGRIGFRLPGIWIVPIVAALIALYLGYRNYASEGPAITISFNTAEGIVAGQTQIKYKAVQIGTVTGVSLDPNTRQVEVEAGMNRLSDPYLTDHARFWVVRPRLGAGSISGIETIVSGAYIQVDPGPPGGNDERRFKGLEDPPGKRYDEPGKTYVLETDRIGSVNKGSPVYFRDINVGEVLNYDIGDGFGPIRLTVFVRAPFDRFVRPGTRFWNASGFGVRVGPEGFRVQLQSVQSVLAGGIDFETPFDEKDAAPVADDAMFTLYPDEPSADDATLLKHVPFVSYFQASVKNLPLGAPVTLYGMRVGTVTAINLLIDQKTAIARVKVAYEIEPDRPFTFFSGSTTDIFGLTQRMARQGLRARIGQNNLLTGQKMISLEFVPNAPPAEAAMEDGAVLLPAGPASGIEGITDAMSDIAGKLDQLPLAQIALNLNSLLAHADATVNGPDLRGALHSLAQTLAQAQDLVGKADRGMTPALQRLPQISAQLEQAVDHANSTLSSVDASSDLQRETRRTVRQAGDAAHALGLLADYLDRHPEALIRGRAVKEYRQ